MSNKGLDYTNKLILMGKCGGLCEFKGCNKILVKEYLTNTNCNISNFAHIIAKSEKGPRGSKKLSSILSNVEDNIMALCPEHHKLIDTYPDIYNIEYLKNMKQEHEKYIENLQKIKMSDFVLPVKYSFSISDRKTVINNEEIKESLNKYSKYYKDSNIIDLTEITIDETSKKQDYEFAARSLKASYEQQIKPLQKKDEVSNIMLYAIAPQPLLIYLGSLFSDIANVQVQQLQREPRIWHLNNEKNTLDISIDIPEHKYSKIALNISISAYISNDRIREVMGEECDIIKIKCNNPSTDIIKSTEQLIEYRKNIRHVYEYIKNTYGINSEIHIFPAMPISISIETGRCWMKKAHPAIIIYDENNGFKEALSIRNAGGEEIG